MNFVGRADNLLLFTEEGGGVVIDSEFDLVVASGRADVLEKTNNWTSGEFTQAHEELAAASLASIDTAITASIGRQYTIPRGVQLEARRALEKRSAFGMGGTPVGLATARTLAAGGQIGIGKVRHIAKYFERHADVRPEKKWTAEATEDIRLSWSMRGGDAARRWATAIARKETPVTADGGIVMPDSQPVEGIEEFRDAYELDSETGPEFLVRVRLDGSGMDRLYKIDFDGQVYVWDDGVWDDMGNVEADIWTYDRALDDPYDTVEKSHIVIDPDSAVVIGARLATDPDTLISVEDLDEDEARMAEQALPEVDWEVVDYGITAAGETVNADGVYDEEERSQNAAKQVRDATGKFAKTGSRVMIGGNPANTGSITRVNPANGTVSVLLESGESVDVPGNTVEGVGQYTTTIPGKPVEIPAIDTTGILAEPRTPINRVGAQIAGTLPQMTPEALNQMLTDWPAYVSNMRASMKKVDSPSPVDVQDKDRLDRGVKGQEIERKSGTKITTDAYDHPLISTWLKKKDQKTGINNEVWYNPITAAGTEAEMTPETSDVQPVYMAVVAPEDPRAVLDVVSLVPASATSNAPMTYTREDGKWVRNEQMIRDLQSATPPPVVPLDSETLNDVLQQVDGKAEVPEAEPAAPVAASVRADQALMILWGPNPEALTAAGGLDQNSGNAEKLRRYWTWGAGGAKIRWGSGGDWTRCVRHLSKYLGPRAKGYCALRHKEMTGQWTGDKRHRQMYSRGAGADFSTDVLVTSDEVIKKALLSARANEARQRLGLLASLSDTGAAFTIPLVLPEGVESGDGRIVEEGATTIRDLPLPLLWQIKTDDGHTGSVVVGRVDHMERIEGGIGNASGVFDTGPYGREAERLVRNGFLRGVSADMDQFEAQEVDEDSDLDEAADAKEITTKKRLIISKTRIMAATIVPKPAFQECEILLSGEDMPREGIVISDEVYDDRVDPIDENDVSLIACGYVASAIPVTPPKDWFQKPQLSGPTPLTVEDDGRVFGHIAVWSQDHIGMASSTKPPRSKSGYKFFHTGVLRTAEGTDIPVGQLTLAGGHASLEASASQAVRHYDDTASAVVDVRAGEDNFGIWVAGALRPGVTPEQIRILRASAPSGDWRPIRGYGLELVAVCQVNVPGFPTARAMVASGSKEIYALVAAGAAPLAQLRAERAGNQSTFVQNDLPTRVAEIQSKFADAKRARNAELASKSEALSARFHASLDEFANVSPERREKLAKEGKALKDGSYPIDSVSDLKKAIRAFGRAKESDRAKVKRHIIKRARALNKYELIPESWKPVTSAGLTASLLNMKARTAAASLTAAGADDLTDEEKRLLVEEAEKRDIDVSEGTEPNPNPETPGQDEKYTPKTQPRDGQGRFRDILARLKSDLGVSGNQDVVEKLKATENLDNAGDYEAASKAAGDLISTIDRLDSGALNAVSVQNVRIATSDLGRVIANLPLPFGNQAQKVRFSDLPPALRQLAEDLIEKVEAKIGAEAGREATAELRGFMSGSDVYSQAEVSAQMNRMLRLLT